MAALTEATAIDLIQITGTLAIQVRRATTILRDGVPLEAPKTYHRVTYEPGADLSQEDPRVQQIAAVLWTPEALAKAEAIRDARTAPPAAGAQP